MHDWSDFAVPVRRDLAGDALMRDWYGVHVRIGETIGARVMDDKPRYIYSDDPTHDEFGAAIRIRSSDADVRSKLEEIGLVEIGRGGADSIREGAIHNLDVTISARQSRDRFVPGSAEEDRRHVEALFLRNGFEIQGEADIRRGAYRVTKGRKDKFSVIGLKIRCTVLVLDAGRALAATAAGIGRDRGLGFGVIVLGERKLQ